MPFYVYILECADHSFYTGLTNNLDRRLHEHQIGALSKSYTFHRRPVRLVWAGEFQEKIAALNFEKQVKGWSREKKKALIDGDWDKIQAIVAMERKNRQKKRDRSTK
jgi:putative endonuclease